MAKKFFYCLPRIIVFSLLVLFIAPPLIALTQINTTVRISVCGDGVAEAQEQCDNSDLRSKNCRSLGYYDGSLTCDPACDFNTSQCSGNAPDPTPSPNPEPTGNQNKNNDTVQEIISQIRHNPTLAPVKTIVVPSYLITKEPVIAIPLLPTALSHFDFNGDYRITSDELNNSLKSWVSSWHYYLSQSIIKPHNPLLAQNCDVNYDRVCNIVDFSIIMSWVNKS